jgi:hypothetical protein
VRPAIPPRCPIHQRGRGLFPRDHRNPRTRATNSGGAGTAAVTLRRAPRCAGSGWRSRRRGPPAAPPGPDHPLTATPRRRDEASSHLAPPMPTKYGRGSEGRISPLELS